MKKDHQCHCHHHHEHGEECSCGHHHEHEDGCCCGHGREEGEEDYSALDAMFGSDVPDDALSLLMTEMEECDELAGILGLGKNPDVDDVLRDAIEELTPKKKKTLMNLAVILHDYLPDE